MGKAHVKIRKSANALAADTKSLEGKKTAGQLKIALLFFNFIQMPPAEAEIFYKKA